MPSGETGWLRASPRMRHVPVKLEKMSNIFDALQKSELEHSEGVSYQPAEATELLQHAERRATAKWECAFPRVQPEATAQQVVAPSTTSPQVSGGHVFDE